MGIVFRQSVKTSIVVLSGAVLGALVNFFYTYVLSKSEIGLVTNIIYLGAVLQYFVSLGMASVIAILSQKYDLTDERRRALLTLGLFVAITTSIIFTIAFYTFRTNILGLYKPEDGELIDQYYFLVPVLVFIWGITSIFDHYLISHVKIAVSAFAREFLLRLFNLILLSLLFFKMLTIKQYIYGSVFIYIIPLVILVFVSSRAKGFGFSLKLSVFDKSEYKHIAHFAWYHLLMIVSLNVLTYFDTLMLGPLDESGMESVAPYRISMFIATLMFMPYRAMATSTLPILNEAFIQKNMEKVRDLFTRAGVNIFIVGVGMFVLIALNLDNAIALLADGYESIKPLVIILMIGRLVDMATGVNNEMISISKHYKFNFRASLLLVIMVYVLDRIYIPQYGAMGAAWVATCSLIVFNLLKMIFLYYKLKLHPFTNKTLLIVAAGAISAGAGYLLPYIYSPVVDAIVRSIIIIIVYTVLLIVFKPSPDLLEYLGNIKKNKRLF